MTILALMEIFKFLEIQPFHMAAEKYVAFRNFQNFHSQAEMTIFGGKTR